MTDQVRSSCQYFVCSIFATLSTKLRICVFVSLLNLWQTKPKEQHNISINSKWSIASSVVIITQKFSMGENENFPILTPSALVPFLDSFTKWRQTIAKPFKRAVWTHTHWCSHNHLGFDLYFRQTMFSEVVGNRQLAQALSSPNKNNGIDRKVFNKSLDEIRKIQIRVGVSVDDLRSYCQLWQLVDKFDLK